MFQLGNLFWGEKFLHLVQQRNKGARRSSVLYALFLLSLVVESAQLWITCVGLHLLVVYNGRTDGRTSVRTLSNARRCLIPLNYDCDYPRNETALDCLPSLPHLLGAMGGLSHRAAREDGRDGVRALLLVHRPPRPRSWAGSSSCATHHPHTDQQTVGRWFGRTDGRLSVP